MIAPSDHQSPSGIVMGFGTFDKLHPGHLNYFDQLKALGNFLIVVIARDKSVERIKGRPAHFNENKRLKSVKECGKVNKVILGNEDDFYQVIHEHKPTTIGLGYDQRANLEELQKKFPDIKVVRLEPFHPHIYKSSLMK